MARKKPNWDVGTVFLVRLVNGECGLGQVISRKVLGSPTVAVCSFKVACDVSLEDLPPLEFNDYLSAVTISTHSLDKGIWKILGHRDVAARAYDPNAKFAKQQWIGSQLFTDNIVEALLNAYFLLEPWDDFADRDALDKLLIPPHRRPENVILKNQTDTGTIN